MFSVSQLAEGILAGNRTLLARAITLIESNAAKHEAPARELVARLLPHTGRARRIGISGVPGVGKSTFIESLGLHLTGTGHKVAVLAIDPSSTRTGGSILGDKTRMEQLSVEANAFIRPSPSGGTLGGVTRKTRESMLLCEAFGFDPILVETVGTGQSETTVRSMVDFFLLLLAPHTGDELQGIKKGIVEMADAVVVNKADGESLHAAERTRTEYNSALHYLHPATPGWKPPCLLASALKNEGISDFWKTVDNFYQLLEPRGVLRERREQQGVEWMLALVREQLEQDFQRHAGVQPLLPNLSEQVRGGLVTPTEAAQQLLRAYRAGA